MKTCLALVSSVNGKLTDGTSSTIYDWTSKEDQQHFFSLIDEYSLIVMGRKTYEASKSVIRLRRDKLRIVMTKSPDRYQLFAVPGQLEFTNETPKSLMKRLNAKGYSKALVVGGNEVAALFLQSNLINTISLTLEPYLFGDGIQFIRSRNLKVDLRLMNIKRLNTKGTILLCYKVA